MEGIDLIYQEAIRQYELLNLNTSDFNEYIEKFEMLLVSTGMFWRGIRVSENAYPEKAYESLAGMNGILSMIVEVLKRKLLLKTNF